MKKILFLLSVLVLIVSCSSGDDNEPFQVIRGEIEQSFTVDWRSLPSNQSIAITNPERIQELRSVTIADFDVQDADEFLDPTISAMYYDISGWETVNSVGLFDVTISILDDFGFPTRLTSFSISNLDNTITLNNNETVLAKEVIFDANDGTVTLEGLSIASRSLLLGRLNIEIEIAGRNVLLQAPDEFELTLSLDLEALASVNEE